ncbi:Auxin-responsive protein IAA9 [Dichanthelium oligosanthes]|uniref:Auxin-responsive protein n=1 Tax=Dichanthelium oligosanthes TaxID=888268 RepID=A0A1E5VP54_9POAL|nr:Auxin-responsive protein IAA9 [Dichanthelium oligosanthes]
MELELGLAPPNARRPMINSHLADELSSSSSDSSARGKRGFREAFQQETLPLFDDGSCRKNKKPLVGWPPVSSARTRACGGANYVKVKKEGDAIGRKVDLSLHASYDELLATLGRMFPTTSNQDDKEISSSASHVVVTYEDGEGDWMLVGDVAWDDFARSVKRLKILG